MDTRRRRKKRLSIFDNCRAQVPYFSVEKLHKIGPKLGAILGHIRIIRISYFRKYREMRVLLENIVGIEYYYTY